MKMKLRSGDKCVKTDQIINKTSADHEYEVKAMRYNYKCVDQVWAAYVVLLWRN
jgi:hypothetical protein